jgi:hypothetical protein
VCFVALAHIWHTKIMEPIVEGKDFERIGDFSTLNLKMWLGVPVSFYPDGRVARVLSNQLIWSEDLQPPASYTDAPDALSRAESQFGFYSKMVEVAPELFITLCKEAIKPYSDLQAYVARRFPAISVEEVRSREKFRDADIPFESFWYHLKLNWETWETFAASSVECNELLLALRTVLEFHLKKYGLAKPWFYDYCLWILLGYCRNPFWRQFPQRFLQAITPTTDTKGKVVNLRKETQADEPQLKNMLKEYLTERLEVKLKPNFYQETLVGWLNRVKAEIDAFEPLAKDYLKEHNGIVQKGVSETHLDWIIQYLFKKRTYEQIAESHKAKALGEDAIQKATHKAADFLDIDLPPRRGRRRTSG